MTTHEPESVDAAKGRRHKRVAKVARRVGEISGRLGTAVGAYLRRLAVVGAGIFFVLSGYAAAESASRSHIVILRYTVLTVLTLVLGILLWLILTSARRLIVADILATFGWFGLPLFAALVFFLAVGDFSAVTFELVRQHLIVLRPQPEDVATLSDFFSWQFLNALPGGVTGTMHWSPPLAYDEQRVGAIIVLYNLAVIAPILACMRAIHLRKKHSHSPGEPAPDQTAQPGSDTRAASGLRRLHHFLVGKDVAG